MSQAIAFAEELPDPNDSAEPTLSQLMSKIYLAYGSRESLTRLAEHCLMVGEQKTLAPLSRGSNLARWREIRKGKCLRRDTEVGGETVSLVYDGQKAWQSQAKTTIELSPLLTQAMSQQADHEPSVLARFEETPYVFSYLGRAQHHGTPSYVIKVEKSDATAVTIFVDQRNYLVTAISYLETDPELKAPVEVTVDYAEYRPVNDTLVPCKQTRYLKDKAVTELSLASVELNANISNDLFQRPSQLGRASLGKSVALKFDYSHKALLIKVRLNDGDLLDFLLDTGASETVIDRRTAAEHFLDKQGDYHVTTALQTMLAQTTSIRKLELGNLVASDIKALILDLDSQSRQVGRHVAGIIGDNVLNQFAVTIDFNKSVILFSDPLVYKVPPAATIIPFVKRQGPVVKVTLNGKEELACLVDTGAAFNNLPTKIAQRFAFGQIRHQTEGTGLDGRSVHLSTVVLAHVKLGAQTVKNVTFTYLTEQDRHLKGQGFFQSTDLGILGNPFWQNFLVTLDYKYKRLILQPNTATVMKQELEQLLAAGDNKLTRERDCRAAEVAYQKALFKAQTIGDAKQQAKIWGRLGNLRRILAKDLNRPAQARVAYEYFSKAQELAHRLEDRETEGRILADWSLLYLDNGQLPAARQALEGAILYAPQDPQVNVDFAVYLYRLGLYSEMQKYIEKALFLDPANWQALWYKVKLAEMFNEKKQLKDTLKELLHHYPWSKLARDKLSSLAETGGN